jgi:hypothetical protein
MRVLACLDPVPAEDGSCAQTAYVEQPSPWPGMTVEQGEQIGQAWMVAVISVLLIKQFLKPSTHRK